MGFNKVSMVFLLLIAAAIADAARVDFLITNSEKTSQSGASKLSLSDSDCCNNCVKHEDGSFGCGDVYDDGCLDSCKNCIALQIYPPRDICVDRIESCPPKCSYNSVKSEFPTSLLALIKTMNKY